MRDRLPASHLVAELALAAGGLLGGFAFSLVHVLDVVKHPDGKRTFVSATSWDHARWLHSSQTKAGSY